MTKSRFGRLLQTAYRKFFYTSIFQVTLHDMIYIGILYEGIQQALKQLWSNKLRSFLSLLGISIGIFCIISVLSAVDSLERDIRAGFSRLGDDVLYVDKEPWSEDAEINYWKYIKRPAPSIADFQYLSEHATLAKYVSMYFVMGFHSLKYRSNELQDVPTLAVTKDLIDVYHIEFSKGRWYSTFEYERGVDMIVLGHDIAEKLFDNIDPIGKYVRLQGRKVQVIGVTKKLGNNLVNPMNFDRFILLSFNLGKKMAKLKNSFSGASSIQVKAKKGVSLSDLNDQLTMLLRKKRSLKPKEKDNFSLNSLSLINDVFDTVFKTLNSISWIIGFFSILVGGFSVSNIMFVSVQERTRFIGVKKALGAKNFVILLEFLVEAVILCLVGGLFGLLLVFGVIKILAFVLNFEMFVSLSNLLLGVGGSVLIGLVSGIVPAWRAAKMEPVVAIRS